MQCRILLCCVVTLLCLEVLTAVEASSVFVKLFPGRELCVTHDVFRDPEAEPVTVGFLHRAHAPRLMDVRTTLYGPSKEPGKRGPVLPLHDSVDTFGSPTMLYFDANESGTYTLCFRTPLRQPVVAYEMSFVAINDVVQPPMVEDDAVVVDKPTEMQDYKHQLHMMEISIESFIDDLRLYQTKRLFFDHTANAAFYLVAGTLLLNIALAVVLSIYGERYLERYFIKQKVD